MTKTSNPPTITEFLLARIAEDEAIAAAGPYPKEWHTGDGTPGNWDEDTEMVYMWPPEYHTPIEADKHWRGLQADPEELAAHIARHDPARVLAECAAKRAIIEQHKDWPVLVERGPTQIERSDDLEGVVFRVSQEMVWLTEREYVKRFGVEAPTTNMILALAAVYKDHPDYRQDWSVG